MLTNRKFALDQFDCDNGIELRVTISFIENDDGKTMELLSFSVTNGYNGVDYASVVDTTTLLDVINEFVGK